MCVSCGVVCAYVCVRVVWCGVRVCVCAYMSELVSKGACMYTPLELLMINLLVLISKHAMNP